MFGACPRPPLRQLGLASILVRGGLQGGKKEQGGRALLAVREPLPGVDLCPAPPNPGIGVTLWLDADDAQALHDSLAADSVPITVAPFDSPFGRAFTVTDLDGYAITIHDQASHDTSSLNRT